MANNALIIKRRNPDGTFGEPVKPFGGETLEEKAARLEAENAFLTLSNVEKEIRLETLESTQAEILLQLLGGN